MLNAREPKIVNGPEILNKFVGASEENIRKLFADAEAEVCVLPCSISSVKLILVGCSTSKRATRAVSTSLSLTS
jgi:hypothetical protein